MFCVNIRGPFENKLVQCLLSLDVHSVEHCQPELLAVQVMLALRHTDEQQTKVKWLEDWGFYPKLESLITKRMIIGSNLQNILMHLLHTIKVIYSDPNLTPSVSRRCVLYSSFLIVCQLPRKSQRIRH